MKRTLIIIAALTAFFSSANAQETPLWLRKNAISPDGKNIAFSYKGDIWVVPSEGGKARQITTNDAYDGDPVWTRDSRSIVFASYREGSKDIFVTSSEGGRPRRLTTFPGAETPLAVLGDGTVLFSANIQPDTAFGGYPGSQVWKVGPEGGRPELLTSLPFSAVSVSKDGKLLYEDYKGYEDPLRKHHTSSVTRDIWLYAGPVEEGGKPVVSAEGRFTKLSDYAGEDRNPVFAADGDTFYYLSEQDGKAFNIYKSSISSPRTKKQLTSYTKDPVRFLSVSDNGILAYSYNGELYTLREGGSPVKVDITVNCDEDERDLNRMTFTGAASSMAVSPTGKEVAVVIRGDVFVTSEEYPTTRRITNTPEQERNVSFSKDGRELYYSSERNGHWGIWRTVLTDKKDKLFTYSVKTREELFSDPGETCFQPEVSPDGKWVAYLRDRTELVIKPTKGGKTISLLKGVNYSYSDGDQHFEWSPDSHYLLTGYQADGGWNNTDIAVIDIESGEITDLTRSGYSDGSFRWALKGKGMTWESDKNGYRSHGSWGAEGDVYLMFFDGKRMTEFKRKKEDEEVAKLLSGESEKKIEKQEKKDSLAEKKGEKIILDLDHVEDRVIRLTRSSARMGDHYLTQDGSKLYYVIPLETGRGLCVMDMKDNSIKVLQRNVTGSIVPAPDDKSLYVFSGAGISKVAIPSGQVKRITFSGEYEFKPKAEREYMFEHIWKQVKEKFYDPGLHGADWDYCRENYSKFLPHINNYYDFQDLLSEMLGELNGSHTGARYRARAEVTFGWLGVLYDGTWKGDGLKIAEVLPNGVLDLADPLIKAGDIIESIDGTPIKAGEDWFNLLVNKNGKKVLLTVSDGKKSRELVVEPSASDANLLYKRWVRSREEMVERLSGGKVGYVHVQSMDSPSFREVYSKALGKYRHCDALIVDTRYNGGGWLHDDLATFLSGEAYLQFQPRGQYIGTEPYNKWTKPSCVLMCEGNYSDACGFPYTYRSLGIGKLIGAPVPGTMTAVWWENQINSSIVFGIPQVGSWGLKEGRYLENFQIEPDILVYNDPASLVGGEDKQLEAAVAEMLKEIDK